MSYYIPIEVKTFSESKESFRDFIKKISAKGSTMIFLSENCYDWLKSNSMFFEENNRKVFKQDYNNTKVYIETINIDSSNCSFLKSISCDKYNYEYLNGIPQKIIMIILEEDKKEIYESVSASVITPDEPVSPIDCIINDPDMFDDSIVFLNGNSYQRLKRNTTTTSNLYSLERLTWQSDDAYPGGKTMLHCLNYGSLYMICSMNFAFFSKDFSFNQAPKAIFFIE